MRAIALTAAIVAASLQCVSARAVESVLLRVRSVTRVVPKVPRAGDSYKRESNLKLLLVANQVLQSNGVGSDGITRLTVQVQLNNPNVPRLALDLIERSRFGETRTKTTINLPFKQEQLIHATTDRTDQNLITREVFATLQPVSPTLAATTRTILPRLDRERSNLESQQGVIGNPVPVITSRSQISDPTFERSY